MKQKLYWLVACVLFVVVAGCATADHFSLQDWRRSHLPTRDGNF
jgi:hypothetical protein